MSDWAAERRSGSQAAADQVVGLAEAEALALAAERGLRARVVRRDGNPLMHRSNLLPGRLDLDVVNGRVTAVRVE